MGQQLYRKINKKCSEYKISRNVKFYIIWNELILDDPTYLYAVLPIIWTVPRAHPCLIPDILLLILSLFVVLDITR